MTVTHRGELSPPDVAELLEAKAEDDAAFAAAFDIIRPRYRAVVVKMLERSSYREVTRLTGLSTNTLQRWKREAGK